MQMSVRRLLGQCTNGKFLGENEEMVKKNKNNQRGKGIYRYVDLSS